jgi:hypothetical protein
MAIIELISAIVGLVLIIEFLFLCKNVSDVKNSLSVIESNLYKIGKKILDEDEGNKE